MIVDDYISFHYANEHVYHSLVASGRVLLARGYQHIGMKMLWEVLRFDWMRTRDPNSDYKLNNNYTSQYARTISNQEADFIGAFELRELRNKRTGDDVVFFWDGYDSSRFNAICAAIARGASGLIAYPDGTRERV